MPRPFPLILLVVPLLAAEGSCGEGADAASPLPSAPAGLVVEVSTLGVFTSEALLYEQEECYVRVDDANPPYVDFSACCPEGFVPLGRTTDGVGVVCLSEGK